MRLRPYRDKSDYAYVEKWIGDKRLHALWCANLIPYPLSREALNAFLEKDAEEWGGCAYVAAEDDGTPMGFFVYSVNAADNAGFLKCIVLDSQLRGKGCGVQMIRTALTYAFEATGADYVQLNVFGVNAPAVGCYEKAGFKVRAVTEAAFRYEDEQWDRYNMVAERPAEKMRGQ